MNIDKYKCKFNSTCSAICLWDATMQANRSMKSGRIWVLSVESNSETQSDKAQWCNRLPALPQGFKTSQSPLIVFSKIPHDAFCACVSLQILNCQITKISVRWMHQWLTGRRLSEDEILRGNWGEMIFPAHCKKKFYFSRAYNESATITVTTNCC